MRGEYAPGAAAPVKVYGSSPHAWRISVRANAARDAPRFIPTCVENMRPQRRQCQDEPVHPHMRGEYARRCKPSGLPARFIPTCVENIRYFHLREIPKPVHPHMRGEYEILPMNLYDTVGSSPHAWRIFLEQEARRVDRRFIPTCVENMQARANGLSSPAVHPHMRGEYDFVAHAMLLSLRFIPTCVENIVFHRVFSLFDTVHPHMRGEYCVLPLTFCSASGSSPHAWRIFKVCHRKRGRGRFIPTCVENMFSPCTRARELAVHPHMRGEYSLAALDALPSFGSSPHAWRIFRA